MRGQQSNHCISIVSVRIHNKVFCMCWRMPNNSSTWTGASHRYPIRPEWRPHYGLEATEVSEHVFFAHVPMSTEPVLSIEHKSWRWCSLSEAVGLLTFGANAQCLQVVDNRLAQILNHECLRTND